MGHFFPWGVCLILACWLGTMAAQMWEVESRLLQLIEGWAWAEIGASDGYWPVVRKAFAGQWLHTDGLHLFGNAAYFFIFGAQIERVLGGVALVLVTIALGVIAYILPAFWYADPQLVIVGASGAVSGLLGMSLLLTARDTVGFWIPLGLVPQFVVVKTWLVIASWFMVQLIFLMNAPNYPSIAVGAHLAGFFGGLILGAMIRPFIRRDAMA